MATKKVTKAKSRRKVIRQKVLDYLRQNPCVDCGADEPVILQFDHIYGIKYGNVSDMIASGCAWHKIFLEINRCAVRCANCHQRRTAIQQGWYKDLV